MAYAIYDRVLETSTSTGTGTITLDGAVAGYQSFYDTVGTPETYYVIEAVDSQNQPTGDWEVGIGQVDPDGVTWNRNTVVSSSNANDYVDFAAGTKRVFLAVPADRTLTSDNPVNLPEATITVLTSPVIFGGTVLGDQVQVTAVIATGPSGFYGEAGNVTNLNADNIATGTLALARGGTGQTTANAAFNALAPSQASNANKFLKTDGTNTSWGAVAASGLTGTLAVNQGGTGQTTATAAFDALAPTQTGNSGKYLTTNGTTTSWGTVSVPVTSVSNSDSTLTVSPTTGSVVASLNLANANTWTAAQSVNNTVTVGASYPVNWGSSGVSSADVGIARKSAGVLSLTDGSSGAGALSVPTPGSGAGNALSLSGSAAASGNTNGGDVLLTPGAKSGSGADGKVVVRKPGGTAGTQEVQLSWGTEGVVESKSGNLRLKSPSNAYVSIDSSFGLAEANNGYWRIAGDGAYYLAKNTGQFGFTSIGATTGQAPDTGIARSAAGVVRLSNGSSAAGGLSSVATTPSQITSNQDNYSPGVGWFQRWSSDAPRNVTGMVAGQDGETRHVWNVGSNDIVLKNETTSTAANQWLTSTGADVTLTAKKCALAMYDGTTQRWRVTLLP